MSNNAPTIVDQPHSSHQPDENSNRWMKTPLRTSNCSPGLEYLTAIDQLLVKQRKENKFAIKNNLGQDIYWAVDDFNCTRNWNGANREFNMHLVDVHRNNVIHLYRPEACSGCCFPCCLQSIEISVPRGNKIGSVEQKWSIDARFAVKNQNNETMLNIEGPACSCSTSEDNVDFMIVTMNGDQVGKISKQWSGWKPKMFTDAVNFVIKFPMDLDVRMKAVTLGACILIDAMYYETTN